jgi:adenosylcobinamide kinase / adenosylcobinamide-phosphate guanylyltransferase
MSGVYLILGGARSGKSSYGEKLAASLAGRTAYLATSRITDEEMEKRVELHRKRRPEDWLTIELAVSKPDRREIDRIYSLLQENRIQTLVVDCVTNLLFRIVHEYRLDDMEVIENRMESGIEQEVHDFFNYFIKKLSSGSMDIIIISNELGMGVVPAFPLGRLFRDLMGVINRELASVSDKVYFFIAGIKQELK